MFISPTAFTFTISFLSAELIVLGSSNSRTENYGSEGLHAFPKQAQSLPRTQVSWLAPSVLPWPGLDTTTEAQRVHVDAAAQAVAHGSLPAHEVTSYSQEPFSTLLVREGAGRPSLSWTRFIMGKPWACQHIQHSHTGHYRQPRLCLQGSWGSTLSSSGTQCSNCSLGHPQVFWAKLMPFFRVHVQVHTHIHFSHILKLIIYIWLFFSTWLLDSSVRTFHLVFNFVSIALSLSNTEVWQVLVKMKWGWLQYPLGRGKTLNPGCFSPNLLVLGLLWGQVLWDSRSPSLLRLWSNKRKEALAENKSQNGQGSPKGRIPDTRTELHFTRGPFKSIWRAKLFKH